jgi:hypothetical protein
MDADATQSSSDSTESNERQRQIVDLAKARLHRDGECEIEDTAKVSEGSDNGAYVHAWVWVDFTGTSFDKEPPEAD